VRELYHECDFIFETRLQRAKMSGQKIMVKTEADFPVQVTKKPQCPASFSTWMRSARRVGARSVLSQRALSCSG
jgi:hypothetical protein